MADCLLSGNSTSAIMDGLATLTLLPHGEDYVISMPYAHCKGKCLVSRMESNAKLAQSTYSLKNCLKELWQHVLSNI